MSVKRQNGSAKQSATIQPAPYVSTTVRLETALRRAVSSVRQMNQDQRRQSLIDAGILTSKGELAPGYR